MESTFTQDKINYIHALLDKELLNLKKGVPIKTEKDDQKVVSRTNDIQEKEWKEDGRSFEWIRKEEEMREKGRMVEGRREERRREEDGREEEGYNRFEEEIFGLQSKISDLEKKFSFLGSPISNRESVKSSHVTKNHFKSSLFEVTFDFFLFKLLLHVLNPSSFLICFAHFYPSFHSDQTSDLLLLFCLDIVHSIIISILGFLSKFFIDSQLVHRFSSLKTLDFDYVLFFLSFRTK